MEVIWECILEVMAKWAEAMEDMAKAKVFRISKILNNNKSMNSDKTYKQQSVSPSSVLNVLTYFTAGLSCTTGLVYGITNLGTILKVGLT